ncbi:MAG: hypothetical protein IK127_08960 [Clostridia bacterium]|nr:hypothetical protein [Clostridia bacterium]
METMEMLWSYMQEDMKADRLNNALKNSPLRQKLEKTREYVLDQQKNYKQIEEQVAVDTDRKDALQDAIARAKEQLEALTARYNENPPADADETRELIKEVEKCSRTLYSYEMELRRIQKSAGDAVTRSTAIRNNTAKAKREFDEMKEEYTAMTEDKKKEYAVLRKNADAKAEGIPAELLVVYNTVKKQISPPMARLVGNQCSGCNTSQPSAALRKIDAGNEIVECETCGRILIR